MQAEAQTQTAPLAPVEPAATLTAPQAVTASVAVQAVLSPTAPQAGCVEPIFKAGGKPASKRRYRPPGPPFHERLYGQNGRCLRVRIEVPAEAEECPLTLGRIAEDAVDFLQPTTTYFTAFPAARKLVLPCGHGFGALNLLYHFARRSMTCPCCRAGLQARLSLMSVPAHFRQMFSFKVSREDRADDQEQQEEDFQVAMDMQDESAVNTLYVMEFVYVHRSVCMEIRYHCSSTDISTLAIRFPLTVCPDQSFITTGVVHFSLPLGPVRMFVEEQIRDPAIRHIALSVFVESNDGAADDVEVARTEPIPLDRGANRWDRSVPLSTGSTFKIDMTEGCTRIVQWDWLAPLELFNRPARARLI